MALVKLKHQEKSYPADLKTSFEQAISLCGQLLDYWRTQENPNSHRNKRKVKQYRAQLDK